MDEIESCVLDATRSICRLFRRRISATNTIETLRNEGFSNISLDFVKAMYDHLSIKTQKYIEHCHDKSEKSLVYTIQSEHAVNVWSERYFLSYKYRSLDSTLHKIDVFDSFNDKASHSRKKWIGIIVNPLDENFGLLKEHENDTWFVSLIFLDFHRRNLQKLDTIKCRCNFFEIIVNKEEPTQFALEMEIDREYFAQTFTVVGTSIISDDQIAMTFAPQMYFDGHLYALEWTYNNVRICMYDLKQKTNSHFHLNLPDGHCTDCWSSSVVEGMDGRIFASLKFLDRHVVIAFIDLQTRRWILTDLFLKGFINEISLFDGKHLVIRSHDWAGNSTKRQFYKISIGKPDLLQNLAWFVLVNYMKRINHPKGAYEAARRFLPYNSKIRCPFAKPEPDEKKGPREKFIKMG